MKQRMIQFATAAALAAGLALAQTPAAPPAHSAPAQAGQHANRRMAFRHRMMRQLNLTEAQKAQAKTLFQQTREKSKPLVQELRQDRQAMQAAVKANDTARIQNLAAKEGKVRGELMAIRSEAMAKFYSNLTPEQRAKADQLHQQLRQRWQQKRTNS